MRRVVNDARGYRLCCALASYFGVYYYEHYPDALPVFNLKLMDDPICLHSYEHSCEYKWYNTEKPH